MVVVKGRTSGGRTPVTPWGKDTKGRKTRSNKQTDKYILRVSPREEEGSLIHGTFSFGRALSSMLTFLKKKAEKSTRVGSQ